MEDLYNRLKALCQERGVSLAKMCSEAGVPKSTPTELKMGRSKGLSMTSAQKIASYFGITVDELLGNEPDIKINLTSEQRSEISEILDKAIKEKNISEGFILARANVQNNIFNQLRNWKHAGISKRDLIAIAQYLDVLEDINLYIADEETKNNPIRIPVFGRVAAGIPISAITDIEDYEEISEDMARKGEYAALKIKGNSMLPRFADGDVVIVRLQDDVDTGDIAIVLVNGDEAVCKKIKKTPEGVMLISTNPEYEPMFYTNKEIEEKPVRVWGKVVELRAKF